MTDCRSIQNVLYLEGRCSPTLACLRIIWAEYRTCTSLEVRSSDLYFKQGLQLIFVPGLLNLEKPALKVKVAHPHSRWPGSEWGSVFCLSAWPSSAYQHWPLTNRCLSPLSMAIILPSHSPDPSRSGRVWKQGLQLADRFGGRQTDTCKVGNCEVQQLGNRGSMSYTDCAIQGRS